METQPTPKFELDGPSVCTNCGHEMMHRSCKVRCLRCGYFEDCSDTGLPSYSQPVENQN